MARTRGAYSTRTAAPALRQAWQSMRVHRRFTSADILRTAEIGPSALNKYMRALAQAGFIRLAKERISGRPGSRNLWQLVRDSGPLPPIKRRDGNGVFDQNTRTDYGLQGRAVAAAAPVDLEVEGRAVAS